MCVTHSLCHKPPFFAVVTPGRTGDDTDKVKDSTVTTDSNWNGALREQERSEHLKERALREQREHLEELKREEIIVTQLRKETSDNEPFFQGELIDADIKIQVESESSPSTEEPVRDVEPVQTVEVTFKAKALTSNVQEFNRLDLDSELRKFDTHGKSINQDELSSVKGLDVPQEPWKGPRSSSSPFIVPDAEYHGTAPEGKEANLGHHGVNDTTLGEKDFEDLKPEQHQDGTTIYETSYFQGELADSVELGRKAESVLMDDSLPQRKTDPQMIQICFEGISGIYSEIMMDVSNDFNYESSFTKGQDGQRSGIEVQVSEIPKVKYLSMDLASMGNVENVIFQQNREDDYDMKIIVIGLSSTSLRVYGQITGSVLIHEDMITENVTFIGLDQGMIVTRDIFIFRDMNDEYYLSLIIQPAADDDSTFLKDDPYFVSNGYKKDLTSLLMQSATNQGILIDEQVTAETDKESVWRSLYDHFTIYIDKNYEMQHRILENSTSRCIRSKDSQAYRNMQNLVMIETELLSFDSRLTDVATFSSTVNNNKYSSMTAATDTFQGNNTEDHWSTYNHQSHQTSSNFSNLSATEHRHLAKEINEMEIQHWTHKKEVNEMKKNKYFNDTKSSEMKKKKNKNATLIETYERYDIGGAGELDLGGQSPRVDPPPALM